MRERLQLPTSHVRLVDCVLQQVAAAFEWRAAGAVRLDAVNCLHVLSGPLVRLTRQPKADEPWHVSLARCTLREAAGVLECRYEQDEIQPGDIVLEVADGVLAPSAGGGLILLAGPTEPTRLARSIRWTGQGSVLSLEGQMVVWRQASQSHPLDEQALLVAGLARSPLVFVGPPDAGPAAARVLRWQAPLTSDEPPGIGDLHFAPPHLSGER
jgi:hypothetical protein